MADPLSWLDDAPAIVKANPRAPAVDPLAFLDDEPGNIDLYTRPHVRNADGSVSTVRSLGINVDGRETLVPTVSEDGRIMSDDEAVAQYRRTGRHLGKFSSVDASNAAAARLHEDMADGKYDQPRPGAIDVGPEARRARAGQAPGPRTADPDPSGPITTAVPRLHDETGAAVFPSPQDPGGRPAIWTNNPEEAGDTLVPAALAGAGAGKVLGAALGAAGKLGAAVGRVAVPAVEGGTANKVSGGDFTTGALVAGAIPAAGILGRGVARAGGAAAGAVGPRIPGAQNAPARVNAAASRAVTGQDVGALAPAEHTRLSETFSRHDDLRRALYDAKANPEKAHTAVSTTIAKANTRIDGDIPKIKFKGSVDEMLADYDTIAAANKGDVAKTEAIAAQRAAVAKTFGKSREATADELRRLTQSIGRGQYASTLYGPIARQLERIAKAADDIDVPAFLAANRDVATLTPYAKSLNERAVSARMGRLKTLKEHLIGMAPTAGVGTAAHYALGMDPAALATIGGTAYAATRIGGAVARRVDYKLAQLVEAARHGPIPRVALEEAAKAGVPVPVLLQLGQRSGVKEGQTRSGH